MSSSTVAMIGDEPMQYYNKFRDITVAVCEKRVTGINSLSKEEPPPDVIILDDAFQHRWVKPGLSLLLLEFDDVFKTNYLLPAGSLREPLSSMKRADAIVITKSPDILVPIERKRILDRFKRGEQQKLFFSYLTYGDFIRLFGKEGFLMFGKVLAKQIVNLRLYKGFALVGRTSFNIGDEIVLPLFRCP